jgi:ribosomal protein L21E
MMKTICLLIGMVIFTDVLSAQVQQVDDVNKRYMVGRMVQVSIPERIATGAETDVIAIAKVLSVETNFVERTKEEVVEAQESAARRFPNDNKYKPRDGLRELRAIDRERQRQFATSKTFYVLRHKIEITECLKGNLRVGDVVHVDVNLGTNKGMTATMAEGNVYDVNTVRVFALTKPSTGMQYQEMSFVLGYPQSKAADVERLKAGIVSEIGKHVARMDTMTDRITGLTEKGRHAVSSFFGKNAEDLLSSEGRQEIVRRWQEERKKYRNIPNHLLSEEEKESLVKGAENN